MSQKYELASQQWIDAARKVITSLSQGHDLSGCKVSFCEEFTDPPRHLSSNGEPICWYWRIDNGVIEINSGFIDADTKIVADYATVAQFSRLTYAEIAENPPDMDAIAGKIKISGDDNAIAALDWLTPLHDEMAKYTA